MALKHRQEEVKTRYTLSSTLSDSLPPAMPHRPPFQHSPPVCPHSSIDQVTSCIQSLPKSPHRHTPGGLLVSPHSTMSTHQLSHPWRNSPCSRQQELLQGAALQGLKASKAKPVATTDWSLGMLTQYRFSSPSSGVHSQPEVWHSAFFSPSGLRINKTLAIFTLKLPRPPGDLRSRWEKMEWRMRYLRGSYLEVTFVTSSLIPLVRTESRGHWHCRGGRETVQRCNQDKTWRVVVNTSLVSTPVSVWSNVSARPVGLFPAPASSMPSYPYPFLSDI